MKHLKLFEQFLNEAATVNIEAAKTSKKQVLFSMNGKFAGKLSFSEVYYKEKNEKRNEEIAELMLKTFPASDDWKKDCENFISAKVLGGGARVNEDVLLKAAKVRSFAGDTGQIQLWDEKTLTHSTTISGPFSDAKHSINGVYAGGIYFSRDFSKIEVSKFTKIFAQLFQGNEKTKTWIEAN
jgi:hypothetical protein